MSITLRNVRAWTSSLDCRRVMTACGRGNCFYDGWAVRAKDNCAPGSFVPVIVRGNPFVATPCGDQEKRDATAAASVSLSSTEDPTRVLVPMQWGLVPSFTKPNERPDFFRMFNARSETVSSNSVFRRLVSRRRAVVALGGFYEWAEDAKKEKQPYLVSAADDAPLLIAALYDCWKQRGEDPEEEARDVWTCTLLTKPSNRQLSWLHDRMPVILQPDHVAPWLDVDSTPFEKLPLSSLFDPESSPSLKWHAVSKLLNAVHADSPDLCVPIDLKAEEAKEARNKITRFFATAGTRTSDAECAARSSPVKRPRDEDEVAESRPAKPTPWEPPSTCGESGGVTAEETPGDSPVVVLD